MITVVIPYFQREPGVLTRALLSVSRQEPCGLHVHVVIVDDASPIPASNELDDFDESRFSIEVIRQENTGPGGARNTGLDHAPNETRYVAFLDSDDEWEPSHLRTAVAALKAGYEFYFSNHCQLDQSIGAFERGGRLNLSQHVEQPAIGEGVFAYQGDMLDQIIRGNLIGTSTVVYDFQRWSEKRFRVQFANAGEDYLFWMEVAGRGAKSIFSTHIEVHYGHGVNIYSASGWGTEQHLLRIHNELKYRKMTATLFELNGGQRDYLERCIKDLRLSFARDLLHRVIHFKKIPLAILWGHFKTDPLTYFWVPFNWIYCVVSKK